MPVVVLTSDKRFDFGAGGARHGRRGEPLRDRLAKLLKAEHVSDTNSGHAIQMEQPRLVIDSIRKLVDAARKSARSGDFAGLVDIGGGRKMYRSVAAKGRLRWC